MIQDFYFVIPFWVVLPVLVLVPFGPWKFVKFLLLSRG